ASARGRPGTGRSSTAPCGPGRPAAPATPADATAGRPPRRAGSAGPGDSTSTRPGSRAPSRGGCPPGGSGGRGLFCSRVRRVGAGDPVLSPPPGDAEALHGQAHGFVAEDPGGPAFLATDLGDQAQGPGGAVPAQGPGTAVEQLPQGFVDGAVPQRPGAFGPGGLRLQTGEPFAPEGVEGVADRRGGAAEVAGNPGRALAGGAGQQDLTAAPGEGVGRAQAGAQLLLLGSGQGPDESSDGSHPSLTDP